jgi:hypothetical protein
MRRSFDRRRARACSVALAMVAIAGCGSTVQGNSATGDSASQLSNGGAANGPAAASVLGSGAPGSSAAGAQLGAASGTGQGANGATTSSAQNPTTRASGVPAPIAGGDRQGLTATTIRIGFVGLDSSGQAETNAAFGATTPPANTQDATNAVVAYINSHGGIDGRKIIPYYVERNTASQDPNEGDTICAGLTDDDHVFAVVTNYTGDAEPCYVKKHTLLLEDDNIFGHQATTAWNPFVWSPGLATVEGQYSALVDGLIAQSYFKGNVKLGLISYDDADTKYVYNTQVKPRLSAMGIKPDIFYIGSNDSQSQFAQDAQNAELRFNQDHVDHVMFMAGGGEAPLIFMHTAETQQYHPRYALSSSDSPAFLLQGKAPDDQLHGAVGVGVTELVDVDASRGDPYPSGAGEKKCYDLLKSAGSPPGSRASAFGAEYLCDGAFMLQAAAQGLGAALSVQTWAAAAERLGRTFQAAYSLPNGTAFSPGLRTGEAVYRNLAFIDSCECFQYSSGNRAIPQ